MAAGDTTKILDSIKAALGLQPDYTPFDAEILMHINSVMANLVQLGVGPKEGFVIGDSTAWSELLLDSKLENTKSYMFMRVKMLFDSATMPPALITAYDKMIQEQEWRLTVADDPMIPWTLPVVDDEEESLPI